MRRLAGIVCLLAAAGTGAAAAGPVEELVMPGPLARAHAELEDDCTDCHRPLASGSESALCERCHGEVALDRRQGRGFHGRHPGARAGPCRSCHAEHRGRDADLVGLEPATFDHRLTDFRLEGAHRGLACGACHPEGTRHREAPLACIGCHRADDPHRGELGEDCGACHDADDFARAPFDHDETGFPLAGRHAEVACGLCHADERYRETPADCGSCHRVDDAHGGRFGTDCGRCHTDANFAEIRFDHGETGFPLAGRHAEAACRSCHAGTLGQEALPERCIGCHRADDAHGGRLGEACGDCHDAVRWQAARFDHARETEFALEGRHGEITCEACHTSSPGIAELPTGCAGCHRPDDVHRGQEGEHCGACHGSSAWRSEVRFDHDLGAFPLLGVHAAVPCEACHAAPTFRDAPRACVRCHGAADPHERRLGATCEACHNPSGWALWHFDHGGRTGFVLRGAHREVACEACHRTPVDGPSRDVSAPGDCVDCHRADDVHRGAFGPRCGRCHGEVDWEPVRVLP